MQITVNNQVVKVEETCSIKDLIEARQYKKNVTAVWVNDRQLLMAEYDNTLLKEGDVVKLVRLFSGG